MLIGPLHNHLYLHINGLVLVKVYGIVPENLAKGSKTFR